MLKKYPHFQQLHSSDCGVVCLRMIAQYYGKIYSTEQLRQYSYQKREGVTLLNISEAAESIGMHTLGAKLAYNRLIDDIPLPGIVHYRENHFVVVYEATPHQVTIGDPAAETIATITPQAFMQEWLGQGQGDDQEGVILLMEPTARFFEREQPATSTIKPNFILENLGSFRKLIAFLAIAIGIGALLTVTMPFFIQLIVDESIEQQNADMLPLVLGAWLLLYVIQIGLEFTRRFLLYHIGSKLNIKLLTDFIGKLLRLPVSFFQSRMTDDVVQIVYDNPRIQRFFTKEAVSVFFGGLVLSLLLLVLLGFSWKLFLTATIFTVLQVLLVRLFIKRRKVINFNRHKLAADRYSRLTDLIRGIKDIKLSNAEQSQRWAWERSEARLYQATRSFSLMDELALQLPNALGELRNILVIYLCASAVIDGKMSLGVLVASMFILTQLNSPVRLLIEFFLSWQDTKLGLERMREVFHYDDQNQRDKLDVLPKDTTIEGENLWFRYEGEHSPWVIQNLDFQIKKGKITAIVGPNGAGKSTLINLLTKFIEPQEGILKIGDVRLSDIKTSAWLSNCGVVPQDGHLFYDTISRNIVLGEEVIDGHRLIEAARVANILHWLERMPNGFNTVVGEGGVGLSKAQKQGILIARAVYKKPDFLFLDEATNDLDAQNEAIVLARIEEAFAGKTVVLVASRVNLPIRIDQVIPLALSMSKIERPGILANARGGNRNALPDNLEELLQPN